jgi:phage-related minor tail protein
MSTEQKTQEQKVSLKYKDRILLSEEEKAQQQAHFKEEEAKYALQGKILGTKKKLAQAKTNLDNAKYDKNFVIDNVVSYMNEVEGLERGLETLEEMFKEMF